jgi:hypothetical protein
MGISLNALVEDAIRHSVNLLRYQYFPCKTKKNGKHAEKMMHLPPLF